MKSETILCRPEEFPFYNYRKIELLEAVIIFLIKRQSITDSNIENSVISYLSQFKEQNKELGYPQIVDELSAKIQMANIK